MDKQVIIKNLLITYSEVKGDGGQYLVFLHGWRSQKEVWQAVIHRLSAINKQSSFYAIDLPGFGGSQTPPKPMTVGDYADVVAEFVKKLELKNVIVIGHSFGGRVGIKLASLHPELISKLVLVDSAGFAMEGSKKTLYNTAAKIVKPFFKPKIMHGLRKKIYQKLGAEDYLATPQLQQTFVNVTGEDLAEDMKKVQAPTLLVYGQNDKDTPSSYGELMKFLIHNSKLIILKNAGHFSFLDKPEEFAEELKKFI